LILTFWQDKSARADIFESNCFLVENHYFRQNFHTFKQPEFEESRRLQLSGIISNPPEIERIESSRATLSYLEQNSSVINASRIYRFLKSVEEPLSSIIKNHLIDLRL
jgi:hypothetical protein